MTEIIVLICLAGTNPTECTINTALEIQKYKTLQLCISGGIATVANDPRNTNETYPKIICKGR